MEVSNKEKSIQCISRKEHADVRMLTNGTKLRKLQAAVQVEIAPYIGENQETNYEV